MQKDGRPLLAGVMGWPVSHSLSPLLHGHWLRHHGLDGHFVPLAVRPTTVASAVRSLVDLGFRGVNVTVPHKEAVFDLLTRRTTLAQRVGAVNLITIDEKGSLEGHNTDVEGFIQQLTANKPDWANQSSAAVVLGAGGAARAILVGLLSSPLEKIFLCNRDRGRAEKLAETLNDKRIEVTGWADRFSVSKGADLLVNTTSLGMKGQPALDMNLSHLAQGAAVFDIVYSPLETDLLRQARQRGLCAIDGLGMLIHQAVPSFEAFFGVRPEVDDETVRLLRHRLENGARRS